MLPNIHEYLIWMDLEMTGLNPDHDAILEIATIITDSQLTIIEEGPVLAIHQDEGRLAAMDDWNQKHHSQSGLLDRVRASPINEKMAEEMTLAFIQRYIPPQSSPLCGNSICQDRRFLFRWMPTLESYLYYRNLDVSTLKELVRRWSPAIPPLKKKNSHEALADIRESIEELKHYKKYLWLQR